jgi:pyrroloquinoline quinone biosynthesis protein E
VRPPPPIGLLAELTHRCPLRCPYCSNPVDLARRSAELDTDTWRRVFREAADLGILHVHLSGGEPTARADIVELTRAATEAGLYTNLITSGVGLKQDRLEALATAGLDHLQLSVQDVLETEADRVAGRRGAHAEKRSVAGWTVAAGMPLTINAVIHRGNIGRIEAIIDEAVALGARRIEIAHAQYYGWGLLNRAALLPEREETLLARMVVERVLSGLAPLPLADNGSVGYRAASHRGADEDAVFGMWIGSRNRATRAHRPGLSPVPLPHVRQAVQ